MHNAVLAVTKGAADKLLKLCSLMEPFNDSFLFVFRIAVQVIYVFVCFLGPCL